MAEFSNEQLKMTPEQEIAEMERALEEKRRMLGAERKEAAVEAAPERAVEAAPAVPAPSVPIPPAVLKEEASRKAKEIKLLGEEEQIKHLSDLAFHKGVAHAVEVARNLDNPYLLDKFHDTLVDRLYQELVKKGRIKKV